jgi:hypothetical protein
MAAVLTVALWQTSTATAVLNPGTKRLLWASLGGVQVVDGRASVLASYRCDEGYRYARWEAWLELAGARFRFRPDCDGYTHVFSSQAPVPDDSSVFAEIQVRLFDSSYNPYPGSLVAQDAATYFAASGLIADADIGYARVDDRGRLEVSYRYECAAGLHVPVEDDDDWAFVEASQARGQRQVWSAWEPIGERVVCDGTRHRIVLPLQGYRESDSAPAHPRATLPIQVNAQLKVVDSADPHEVWGWANRQITVLP